MLQTALLAKVLGVFLIVIGATVIARRHYLLPVFATYGRERLLRICMSMIELLIGLFIIMRNDWSSLPAVVISLIGWMVTLEGAAYLLLTDEIVETILQKFNTAAWYIFGGLLAIVAGIYLAAYGFGII